MTGGRGGKKGPNRSVLPTRASWLTRVQKDGYLLPWELFTSRLFIRRLDSIVKKKKKTGWWSIEAPSANRRKEETIAAGVDVKFMTGCKHGNSLSLSLSLARSFYHSFQILPSDFHRRIASGGTGRRRWKRKRRGNARVELIETESVELPARTYKENGGGGKVIRYKTLEKNRTFSTIPRGLFPTTRAH